MQLRSLRCRRYGNIGPATGATSLPPPPADDRDRSHVRLVLGRAAAAAISAAHRHLDRRRQLGQCHWLNGKLPSLIAPPPSPAPNYGPFPTFPLLPGQGWSSVVRPKFATQAHDRASGKSSRRARMRWPLYEIELTFDFLRGDATQELQQISGFFASQQDRRSPSGSRRRAFRR